MSSVDNRVVILQFDNKDFEKNVQTSMSTLDRLKQNLDLGKSAKSFDVLSASAKSFDLGPMGRAIESIRDRFSNLGVIGMTVLQNLTNTAVDFGKKLISGIFTPITQGGWKRALDIEQATFQMEGLLGKTEGGAKKIKAIMNEVTASVQGTAFGANEAARVASQLVATGVEDAQQMRTYLDGVAGAAAMTGGAYDEIGHIFTTVAGQGRLMADQLNQFAYRGLNIAATLSKQMGITEAEFRDLVSKGKISFDQFAEGMAKAFGDQAVKANETFTGSLSNMKAALARIGQDFAAPALTNLRDIFNSLRGLIDAVHAKLQPLINLINNNLTSAAKKAVKFIDDLTEALGGTSSRMKKETKKTAEAVQEASKMVSKSSEEIEEVAKRVIGGEFGNGVEERRKQLEALGYSFEEVQNKVNELQGSSFRYEVQTKETAETTKEAAEETEKLADRAKTLNGALASDIFKDFYFSVWNIKTAIQQFGKSFKEAFLNTFNGHGVLIGVRNVSSAFKKFTQSLLLNRTEATGLQKILEGVFSIIGKGASLVLKGVEYFLKFGTVINNLTKKFLGFIGSMYDANGQIDETTRRGKFFATLGDVVNTVGEAFGNFKEKVKEVAERVYNTGGFVHLRRVLSEIWEKLKEIGGSIIDSVIEKMEKFTGLDFNFEGLDSLVPLLGKAAGHVADFIEACSNGVGSVKEFFKGLFGIGEEDADSTAGAVDKVNGKLDLMEERLDDIIGDKSDSFLSKVKKIGEFISQVKQVISDFLTGNIDEEMLNTNIGENIKNFFKSLGEAFLDIIESIDWGTLISKLPQILIAFGIMKTLLTASDLYNSIRMFMDGVSQKLFRSFNSKANQFKSVATGVLMIAAALFIVSTIPTDRLITAGIVLGVLSGVIVIAVTLFQKLNSSGNWDRMKVAANQFLKIAASMLILSIAMKAIGSMETGDIIKAGVAITAMITVFTIASRALNNVKSGAAAFLAMALAMDLLIPAILVFGNMKTEKLIKAGVALVAFLGSMVIVSRLAKSCMGGAASMIAMALALDLLIPAILVFGNMKTEKLVQAGVALVAFLTSMAIATRLADSAVGGAVSMMAMAVAIDLLIPAVLVFGNMDTGKLIQAGIAIVAFLTAMAAVSNIAQGSLSGAVSMLLMIAPVIAAAAALRMLGDMPWQNIIAGAASLSGVLLSMAAALKIAGTTDIGSAVALDLMVLALMGAAQSISMLAQFDWKSIVAAAASLAGVVLALSVALNLMSAINPVSGILGAVTLGAAIDIIMLAVTGLLAIFGKINEAGGLDLIKKGSEVLDAIGGAIGSFIGSIGEGVASHLPAIGDDLSAFAEKIGPFLELCGTYGADAATTIGGLATGLGMIVGSEIVDNLQKLFTGDSSLSQFGSQLKEFGPSLQEFASSVTGINVDDVKAAAEALTAIATASGTIPNEGESILKWLVGDNTLAQYGPELAEFGGHLKRFALVTKGISSEDVTSAADALTAIAEASGTIPNEGSSILKWLVGDNTLAQYGPQLASFGGDLKRFALVTRGISAEEVQNAADALKAIAEASGTIPSEQNSVVKWLLGDDSLANFGPQLAEFGGHLKRFALVTKGISSEDVISAADALTAIASAAVTIPNEGKSLASFFVGDNTLSDFGPQLAEFGGHLKRFALLTTGITAESIDPAVTAMTSIIEAADGIDEQGGLKSLIEGDNTLSTFGQELEQFGTSLGNFAGSIQGTGVLKIAVISKIMPILVDTAKKAEDISQGNLSAFGLELSEFGGYLSILSDDAASFDAVSVEAAVDAINKLIEAANSITETAATNFSSLAEVFSGFGGDSLTSLTSGFEDSEGAATEAITGVINNIATSIYSSSAVEELKTAMQTAGENAVNEFINAFENAEGDAESAVKGLASAAQNGLPADFASKFKSVANTAATNFVAALSSQNAKAYSSAQGLASSAKNGLNSEAGSGSWYTIGANCASGFVQGLGNSAAIAAAAAKARELVKAAKRAAESESRQASPSKVFYKIGYYCVLGFANALRDGSDLAGKYGRKLVSDTISQATRSVELMQEAFASNTEIEPIITPIIDLSNIKSGARRIDSLLTGSEYGIGVNNAALMSQLAFMTSAGAINGNNSDVVDAINGLKNDNLGNVTFNITVDGAENPEAFADRLVRSLKGRARI